MSFGPSLPFFTTGVGYQTKFGPVVMEPGSRVAAYVRSTGAVSDEDPVIATNLVADIPTALSRCRSGKNDVVFVLPGHTENVTSTTLANLVPGTRIIGCGRGSNRPNLRWTATSSQFVMNDADCVIMNFILRMEGAVVVKAVAVTAADCAILGCDIDMGSTASTNLATIGISVEAGADRFLLQGNYIHTIAGATPTQVVVVAGAADGVSILDNKIMAATSAVTKGVIDITAAATGLDIGRNLLQNRIASSETVLSVGAVAATGVYYDNYGATEAGTPVSDIFEANAASLLRPFQNFGTDTKGASGLLSPAVVT
jgi:hypothetical protein